MRSLRRRAKAVSTYFAERREADRFQPEGWETAEGRALLSQYRAEMNGKTPAADLTGETTGPIPRTTSPMPDTAGPMPTGRGVARVPPNATPSKAAPPNAMPPNAMPSNPAPPNAMPPNAMPSKAAPSNAAPCNPAPCNATPSNEVARRPSTEVARYARHSSDEVAAEINHRPRHDGTQSEVDQSYLLSRPPTTRHGTPGPAETARVLTITNVVRGPDGDPLAGAIVTISVIADYTVPGLQPNATIEGVARIVSAEEGTWSVEETTGSQLVPVNTHYQIANVPR